MVSNRVFPMVNCFFVLLAFLLTQFSWNPSNSVHGNFIREGYRTISHVYGSLKPNHQQEPPASTQQKNNVTHQQNVTTAISQIAKQNDTRKHIASFAKLKQPINLTTTTTGFRIPSRLQALFRKSEFRDLEALGVTAILGEVMNFFRPYFIASGNLLGDIQDAVPDVITGTIIAFVMFKGIIFATFMMLNVILLPLPFWIFLIGTFIVGGYLYTISYDRGHEEDAPPLPELFDDGTMSMSRNEYETQYRDEDYIPGGQVQGQGQLLQATTASPSMSYVKYSQHIPDEQQQYNNNNNAAVAADYNSYNYNNYYDHGVIVDDPDPVRRNDYTSSRDGNNANVNTYYDQYRQSTQDSQSQSQSFQKRMSEYGADYRQYVKPPAVVPAATAAVAAVQQYSSHSPYSILSTNCTTCYQPAQHSIAYQHY